MTELGATPRRSPSEVFGEFLARQGPEHAPPQLSTESIAELIEQGSTPIAAVVAVGDLRMSTLVMKESIRTSDFARFLVGFTEAIRGLSTTSGGWFDKFTGDGFVSFWIQPDTQNLDTRWIPEFCRTAHSAADALLGSLRRNSRNFPTGVGMSIGVDAGPCELVRVGEQLTVVGSPTVGATRMVTGGAARETILNVYPGTALEGEAGRLASEGIRLERTVIRTKEYPDGQEAFKLVFVARELAAAPAG